MTRSRLTGWFFFGLFAAYGYLSFDIQLDLWAAEELFTAQTFPQIIAVGGAFIAFLLAIAPAPIDESTTRGQPLQWAPVVSLILLLLLFGQAFEYLGFILVNTLFLMLASLILGERRFHYLAIASLPLVGSFYLLLTALDIHVEPGLLGAFL